MNTEKDVSATDAALLREAAGPSFVGHVGALARAVVALQEALQIGDDGSLLTSICEDVNGLRALIQDFQGKVRAALDASDDDWSVLKTRLKRIEESRGRSEGQSADVGEDGGADPSPRWLAQRVADALARRSIPLSDFPEVARVLYGNLDKLYDRSPAQPAPDAAPDVQGAANKNRLAELEAAVLATDWKGTDVKRAALHEYAALRAAQPTPQEPVAWGIESSDGKGGRYLSYARVTREEAQLTADGFFEWTRSTVVPLYRSPVAQSMNEAQDEGVESLRRALGQEPDADGFSLLTTNIVRNWSVESMVRLRDFLARRTPSPDSPSEPSAPLSADPSANPSAERMASACEQAAIEGMNIPEDVRGALMDAAAALRAGSAPLEHAGERRADVWERAVRRARGCLDYSGGYKLAECREAFLHGVQTVVNALSAGYEAGTQERALERSGAASQPEPKP
jgi:hypothetical protein